MNARKTHLDGLASVILLACCVFWGFQQVLVKVTLDEVSPVWQAALRFIGATVLLLVWMRWRRIPLRLSDGSARAGIWVGLLFSGEFVFFSVKFLISSSDKTMHWEINSNNLAM